MCNSSTQIYIKSFLCIISKYKPGWSVFVINLPTPHVNTVHATRALSLQRVKKHSVSLRSAFDEKNPCHKNKQTVALPGKP